jgi:hypothetical protein
MGVKSLKQALNCYNQADKFKIGEMPDLHYNRAMVLLYLMEYEGAIRELALAEQLDKSLNAAAKLS